MLLNNFLVFLQESRLAHAVDGSRYLIMLIQLSHILAFTLLIALVLAFTLRTQGWALGSVPLAALARSLQVPYRIALSVALLAGFLLFVPRAVAYGNNSAFLAKLLLLVLAAVSRHFLTRKVLQREVQLEVSTGLKYAAATSLLLWFATAIAGRTVGFV